MMTDRELLDCLTDRPCQVCKFNKEDGCCKWECVFDHKKPTDMTEDTQRALDIIKPICDELGITVSADETLLHLNKTRDTYIGIRYNSTYATLMEFVGYLFIVQYVLKFRLMDLTEEQKDKITRYWMSQELMAKCGLVKGDKE